MTDIESITSQSISFFNKEDLLEIAKKTIQFLGDDKRIRELPSIRRMISFCKNAITYYQNYIIHYSDGERGIIRSALNSLSYQISLVEDCLDSPEDVILDAVLKALYGVRIERTRKIIDSLSEELGERVKARVKEEEEKEVKIDKEQLKDSIEKLINKQLEKTKPLNDDDLDKCLKDLLDGDKYDKAKQSQDIKDILEQQKFLEKEGEGERVTQKAIELFNDVDSFLNKKSKELEIDFLDMMEKYNKNFSKSSDLFNKYSTDDIDSLAKKLEKDMKKKEKAFDKINKEEMGRETLKELKEFFNESLDKAHKFVEKNQMEKAMELMNRELNFDKSLMQKLKENIGDKSGLQELNKKFEGALEGMNDAINEKHPLGRAKKFGDALNQLNNLKKQLNQFGNELGKGKGSKTTSDLFSSLESELMQMIQSEMDASAKMPKEFSTKTIKLSGSPEFTLNQAKNMAGNMPSSFKISDAKEIIRDAPQLGEHIEQMIPQNLSERDKDLAEQKAFNKIVDSMSDLGVLNLEGVEVSNIINIDVKKDLEFVTDFAETKQIFKSKISLKHSVRRKTVQVGHDIKGFRSLRYGEVIKKISLSQTEKQISGKIATNRPIDYSDIRLIEEKPLSQAHIIVCLDVSGSMSGGKIHLARESLKFLVSAISRNRDKVSIVSFNVLAGIISDWAVAKKHKVQIYRKIESMRANGGTKYSPAITLMRKQFEKEKCKFRFAIFISDGAPSEKMGEIREKLKELTAINVVLSTVGINAYGGERIMREMAKLGRGTYFSINNANELRNLLLYEYGQKRRS